MKKKIEKFCIGIVVLIGVVLIGIKCVELYKDERQRVDAEQRRAEEAQCMEQIQSNFEEMVDFTKEYAEDIEALSVASIEQVKGIERLQDFDYEKACKEAGIGETGALIKERFQLNTSVIMQSLKWQNEDPEECLEVQYSYICTGIGSTEMYLIYFSDASGEPGMGGSPYGECVQITEQLYAVWYIPLYT